MKNNIFKPKKIDNVFNETSKKVGRNSKKKNLNYWQEKIPN